MMTEVINKTNYYRIVNEIGLNKFPKPIQDMHESVNVLTSSGSDWVDYDSDPDFKEYTDKQFKAVEKWMNENNEKPTEKKTVPVEKKEDIPEPKLTLKAKKSKVVKTEKTKKAKKEKSPIVYQGKMVEKLMPEIQFIKRYTLLDGKTKTKEEIRSFYNALKTAILTKQIRKTSIYKNEIEDIMHGLVTLYNSMGNTTTCTIDPKILAQYKEIAKSEKVMLSVQLIRAYVKLLKEPLKGKAKDLYDRVVKGMDSEPPAIPAHCCPYINEISFVRRSLYNFIEDDTKMSVDEATLNGLQAICDCEGIAGLNTLADLKKKLQKGVAVKMVNFHGQTPEKNTGIKALGLVRYVVKTQGNGVYFNPDKNATSGSFWDFPPASLCEVNDKRFKVYGEGKRPLTAFEQNVFDNQPRDAKQEEQDAMTDGNTMYYRRKSYFKNNNLEYLFSQHDFVQGKKYDYNSKMIIDKSIKGNLELAYEFVDENSNKPEQIIVKKEENYIKPTKIVEEKEEKCELFNRFKGKKKKENKELGSPITTIVAATIGIAAGNLMKDHVNKVIAEKKMNEIKNKQITSGADIANEDFKKIGFKGKWFEFFGDPEPNFKLMIYGYPGTRKSTFIIEFANYLANNHGKVLYIAYEEGIGLALKEKITRLSATHENLMFSASLPADISDFKFVIMDTVNKAKLSNDDLSNLKIKYPNTAFIYVFQVTKAGVYKGEQDYEHDVDIVVNAVRDQDKNGVTEFKVITKKNKYTQLTSIPN